MGQILTHPACGQRWIQKGNQTGHCSACHRTFDSGQAFDLHQKVCAVGVTCLDPAGMVRTDGSPRFLARTGTAQGDSDTIYWRLAPTDAQAEWLRARAEA